MAASINVHDVTTLKASTHDAVPHIKITSEGDRSEARTEIIFYVKDEVLISRLVEAINAVSAARADELKEQVAA